MNALTTTPPATRAIIIRAVIAEPHPKLALGNIAHRFHLTLEQLQAMLRDAGYPDTDRMARRAVALEHQATNGAAGSAETVTTGPETATPTGHTDTAPDDGVLTKVPLRDLHPDPDNPREHLDDIDELADSIQEIGLLQPIVARRHHQLLYVVAGHRRLAAVRQLRWTHVDVIIRNDMRPDHVLAAMLIENGQRTDLDPIEEARGLAKLKAIDNCSDRDLGHKIGRSQVHVSGRLALLSLTPEEQAQVRGRTMSVTEATARGRLAAGKVRPGAKGKTSPQHLAFGHPLANKAKARCISLGHSRGKGSGVGGIACGSCWETVIRADERAHLHTLTATAGECALCGKANE